MPKPPSLETGTKSPASPVQISTPLEIHTHNFTGSFNYNKARGDDTGPVLKMQGVPWFFRQAAAHSPVHVNLKMYTDDSGFVHLDQEQCTPLYSKVEPRVITGEWTQVHVDFWGDIKGYSKFVGFSDLEDEFLKEGWLDEGEGEEKGDVVFSHAESLNRGWIAEQAWGFALVDGCRTFVRKIVAKKGKEVHKVRMIYEYRST